MCRDADLLNDASFPSDPVANGSSISSLTRGDTELLNDASFSIAKGSSTPILTRGDADVPTVSLSLFETLEQAGIVLPTPFEPRHDYLYPFVAIDICTASLSVYPILNDVIRHRLHVCY